MLALISSRCSGGRSDAGGPTSGVKRSTTSTSITVESPPATTSTTASTPTSAASTADEVLTAYLAFWDLYIELGSTPPPFDPGKATSRLGVLTTGPERAQLFDFLQKNAATGLVLRGDLVHAPSVASNDGSVAVVEDCMDDRIGVYRVSDNSRVDTDDPARRLYTVALRKVDSLWKVESVATRPEPCTA